MRETTLTIRLSNDERKDFELLAAHMERGIADMLRLLVKYKLQEIDAEKKTRAKSRIFVR